MSCSTSINCKEAPSGNPSYHFLFILNIVSGLGLPAAATTANVDEGAPRSKKKVSKREGRGQR